MATPPFNLDISDPADGAIGQSFPQNERSFRDQVNSYLNTDHDPVTGHHAIPQLTTSAISALTTPPAGMLVFDTTLSLFKINIGTPSAPVWLAIGPGIAAEHAQLFTPAGGATQLFVIPVPSVKFTIAGAGGGGGGGGFGANYGGGGGGGSGGVITTYYTGLTIGANLTISLGSHGSAGASGSGTGTAGTAGGNSSVTSGTMLITSSIANGGQPGQPGNGSAGGAGGAGGGSTGPAGALSFAGANGFQGGFGGVANGFVPGGRGGLIPAFPGALNAGGDGGSSSSSAASNGGIGFDGYVIAEWLQ